MVVAQFTGVSLQKDDRAFVKFTETTTPNPSFVLEGGATDAVALHQILLEVYIIVVMLLLDGDIITFVCLTTHSFSQFRCSPLVTLSST